MGIHLLPRHALRLSQAATELCKLFVHWHKALATLGPDTTEFAWLLVRSNTALQFLRLSPIGYALNVWSIKRLPKP